MAKDKGGKPKGDPEPDAPEGAEGVEGEAPKKKKLPVVLIGAAAAGVLVLGGGGAGAYFLFLKPKPEAGAHADEAHAPKKAKKKKEEKGGHGKGGKDEAKGAGVVREGPDGVTFYTMPDLVVNIQSADGRPTFLKLKLTFELDDPHAVEALDPNAPRLQDMFQSFLRELRPEDLQGSAGSYQLRMEILRRVNLVVAPAKVKAVLIEEMLIQ